MRHLNQTKKRRGFINYKNESFLRNTKLRK